MGWWANRRERKRKEREDNERFREDMRAAWHQEHDAWAWKRARAIGKAEEAAERGDGNGALAWMRIYDDLKDKAPPYPWTYY